MYFLNGSKCRVDESKSPQCLPYKVTQLPAPFRLQVDLKIGFWDYADNNETYNDSIIYGLFNTAHSDSDEVSIFFQLNEDVQTTVRRIRISSLLRCRPSLLWQRALFRRVKRL